MFLLAHLSDLHIGPLPAVTLRDLASKRALGYINWRRNRILLMEGGLVMRTVEAVKAAMPDHIAVTGDLVNIALKSELKPARAVLEMLGSGENVTVVPGNHDAYVPGALLHAQEAWAPYMTSDVPSEKISWPIVRRRGDVALIGVSTATASGPFMATGYVTVAQTDRLAALLHETRREGLCRVVLIHHPPVRGATDWHKRLIGASRVRAAIAAHGAELVLHGHTHLATKMSLDGPEGSIPVISVPSAAQRPGGRKPGTGFNLFSIERGKGHWRITLSERRLLTMDGGFETLGDYAYLQAYAAEERAPLRQLRGKVRM